MIHILIGFFYKFCSTLDLLCLSVIFSLKWSSKTNNPFKIFIQNVKQFLNILESFNYCVQNAFVKISNKKHEIKAL